MAICVQPDDRDAARRHQAGVWGLMFPTIGRLTLAGAFLCWTANAARHRPAGHPLLHHPQAKPWEGLEPGHPLTRTTTVSFGPDLYALVFGDHSFLWAQPGPEGAVLFPRAYERDPCLIDMLHNHATTSTIGLLEAIAAHPHKHTLIGQIRQAIQPAHAPAPGCAPWALPRADPSAATQDWLAQILSIHPQLGPGCTAVLYGSLPLGGGLWTAPRITLHRHATHLLPPDAPLMAAQDALQTVLAFHPIAPFSSLATTPSFTCSQGGVVLDTMLIDTIEPAPPVSAHERIHLWAAWRQRLRTAQAQARTGRPSTAAWRPQ